MPLDIYYDTANIGGGRIKHRTNGKAYVHHLLNLEPEYFFYDFRPPSI